MVLLKSCIFLQIQKPRDLLYTYMVYLSFRTFALNQSALCDTMPDLKSCKVLPPVLIVPKRSYEIKSGFCYYSMSILQLISISTNHWILTEKPQYHPKVIDDRVIITYWPKKCYLSKMINNSYIWVSRLCGVIWGCKQVSDGTIDKKRTDPQSLQKLMNLFLFWTGWLSWLPKVVPPL